MDFFDAVNYKRTMAIHRDCIGQPWTHLTNEQSIVLFCRNILPRIVPELSPCKSWSEVPPGQNLLAAMGSTVHALLDCKDNGLAEGLDWCPSSRLIETHRHAGKASIRHVQKLQSKNKPLSNARIRTAIEAYLQGAFIFGNGKEGRKVQHALERLSNQY